MTGREHDRRREHASARRARTPSSRASSSARPAAPTSHPRSPPIGPPRPPATQAKVTDESPRARPTEPAAAAATAATQCGGAVADDGYCTECGAKARSLRDHFTEQPATWVAAVCDRGIRHHRNEDAVALEAERSRAATPCSSSATACRARRTPTSPAWPPPGPHVTCSRPLHPPGSARRRAASPRPRRRWTAAADVANDAVIANTGRRLGQPGVVHVRRGRGRRADRSWWAGSATAGPTGSRTPGRPRAAHHRRLVCRRADRRRVSPAPRRRAAPQAHAITQWLGSDAPDHMPRTVVPDLDGRLGAGLLRRPVELLLGADRTGGPRPAGRSDAHGPNRSRWPPRSSPGRTSRAVTTTSPSPSPASARVPRTGRTAATSSAHPAADRKEVTHMATFSADVYQNEFLPDGGTDVHAIVTVTCTGAGAAGSVGEPARRRDHHHRHLGVDGAD